MAIDFSSPTPSFSSDDYRTEDEENNEYVSDDWEDYEENQAVHTDLYKKLTDFKPYLSDMIMNWLGMYYNENKKKFVRQKGVNPTMNIQGARWCITFLRTYTRDNNILTNIGENTFKYIMQDVIRIVYYNIGTRYKEFEIIEMGDIYAVSETLIHAVELVLTGATGHKVYMDAIGGSYRMAEHGGQGNQNLPIVNNQPQKKGIIRRFFGG